MGPKSGCGAVWDGVGGREDQDVTTINFMLPTCVPSADLSLFAGTEPFSLPGGEWVAVRSREGFR